MTSDLSATTPLPAERSGGHEGPPWLVGVGRADVTDRRPGLGMAGFAYPRQRTSGELLRDPDGNEMPLYARAFYFQQRAPDRGQHPAPPHAAAPQVLVVIVEIWTCTMAVKAGVLERLNLAYPASGQQERFTHANVLIAGTHTHAAPGGYSDYALYNFSMGGWNQQTFDIIVEGITAAARRAIDTASPGRVLVNRGDLFGCGGNRAMAALRRNPEFQHDADPSSWTDTEMLVLRLVADTADNPDPADTADPADSVEPGGEAGANPTVGDAGADSTPGKDIGALTWFAIHPTSLGIFNRTISGDNKGWAAMLFERDRCGGSPAFVAAFANANAGDVSGNVSVDPAGYISVRRPFGGERPDGVVSLPRQAPAGDREGDLTRMRHLGRLQFEAARALYVGATRQLTGSIDHRAVFVDMSRFDLGSEFSEGAAGRTAAAAFGVSFGSGSTEDGIAFASLGPCDVDVHIPEGMTRQRLRRGAAGLAAATAAGVALAAAAAVHRRPLWAVFAGALPVAVGAAVPSCRGVAAGVVARRALASELPRPDAAADTDAPTDAPTDADSEAHHNSGTTDGRWFIPSPGQWPAQFRATQAPKAVMFPAGLAKWQPALAADPVDCPLVPNVVPVQVITLGGLGIVAVPAEFTSTAGRRLKHTLHDALGPATTDVALTGYANGYSGYVTTAEEYDAQLYEGASTLYGRHTLAAYQQVARDLATAITRTAPVPVQGGPYVEPFAVPVVAGRT